MKLKNYFRRTITLTITAGIVLGLFGYAPRVHAYNEATNREIEMSNSTAGATNVTYSVSFTTATTGPIEGIVVDFCDNDPIISDSCTYNSGQSIGIGSATVSAVTGPSNTGFSIASQTSPLLVLTDSSASSSVSSGTSVSFSISGVTNPSYSSCGGGTVPNCTFYGRILTYSTTSGATSYTPTAIGSPSDAGGVALSTAANITVTAKVQEQLNFCIYTGINCAAGGTSVLLGDANGILSTSGPYIDKNTRYDISTNASSGAIIRMKGTTLTSGSNTITAIGGTAAASNPGNAQFGLCNYQSSGANLTAASPYNNAGCSGTTQSAGTGTPGGDNGALFAFNTTNTTSIYGDQIASTTAGPTSTGTIVFIGNIPVNQVAGIYTTALTFIATGTY